MLLTFNVVLLLLMQTGLLVALTLMVGGGVTVATTGVLPLGHCDVYPNIIFGRFWLLSKVEVPEPVLPLNESILADVSLSFR